MEDEQEARHGHKLLSLPRGDADKFNLCLSGDCSRTNKLGVPPTFLLMHYLMCLGFFFKTQLSEEQGQKSCCQHARP